MHGRFLGDWRKARGIGAGAEGRGGSRRSHRVVHLAADDPEEIAAGPRPYGYLRKDRTIPEDTHRQALEAGRPAAQGRAEAESGRAAVALAGASTRVDSPKVRGDQRKTDPSHLPEGT